MSSMIDVTHKFNHLFINDEEMKVMEYDFTIENTPSSNIHRLEVKLCNLFNPDNVIEPVNVELSFVDLSINKNFNITSLIRNFRSYTTDIKLICVELIEGS